MRQTSKLATTTPSNHCGYEALDWCNSSSCDNCDRSSSSGTPNFNTNGEGDNHHKIESHPPRPKVSVCKVDKATAVDGITSASAGSTSTTVNTTATTPPTPNKKLSFPTKLFSKRRPQNKNHPHLRNTTNSTMVFPSNSTAVESAYPIGTGPSTMIMGVRVESSASSTSTASSTQPDEYMTPTTPLINGGIRTLMNHARPGTFAPQISPTKQDGNSSDEKNSSESPSLQSSAMKQPQHIAINEERYLGPIDLDTLSEEDLCFDEKEDDRNISNNDDDISDAANIALVTTNTSDIFASIAPTKSSSASSKDNHELHSNHTTQNGSSESYIDDDNSIRKDQEMSQDEAISTSTLDENEASSSLQLMQSAFQPILQTEEDFGCFPDCNTFLLSSLLMMASPSSEQPPETIKESLSPKATTTSPLEQFPLLTATSQHSVDMSNGENEVEHCSVSSNIDSGMEAETDVPSSMENNIEDGTLQKNPSISSCSTTIAQQQQQFDNPTTAMTIDPLLLLLQQSSSARDGSPLPKRHPKELDAMLLRVLQHNDEADETTTVASADFHLKKDMRATTSSSNVASKTIQSEEPNIDDVGGLMGALAAGPVDVDDFIPEDSYWAMDTHEFILDELELSRQLIGYHEGCEPPTINDISLLTDDDDEEDDEVPVVMKKAVKRDVRQDLILHRTNKMTRQRTSATADSNELIRRSQAIQQQQYIIGGLPQRPATITQKNRIRSDPSVVPSRTTASSSKQSYPTNRFPTPTIMSRQKPQRQPVSPPRNATYSVTALTKAQMQQQHQQRKAQPISRDVTSMPQASNYNSANKRFLYPTTPTTTTKSTVSSLLRAQPPPPSPATLNHFRSKNSVATTVTGPSATRTHPDAAAALPIHDVQRRRVVDIDLTTNPQRVIVTRPPTTDERGHWMRSKAQQPPPTSSQLSRYSTTAAEV